MNETNTISIAWVVEFGGSAVRRFRLTRTDGGYCADHYTEAPLAARWSASPEPAAAAGQLPTEEISGALVACLGNDLVLYRTAHLPPADDATLEKMVHSQLETLLPAQLEKFATAWKTQPRSGADELQRVLLCAVRRESLAAIAGVCQRWSPRGADVTPSLTALAAAWANLADANEPVLLMDVGARSTAMATVRGKDLWRCAVVDAGGDVWTEQLAKAMNLPCEEAEKRKLQLARKDDPAVTKILDEALMSWSGDVREAYNDCLSETPADAKPTRCVLFGRGARLAGVAARVSAALGIAAAVAEAPEKLCLDEDMNFDSAAAAIGAGIEAMQAPDSMIRLTRRKEDKPAVRHYKHRYWAAAIAWLVASVLGLYLLDLHEASSREEMVDTVYRETYHQGGLMRQLAVGNYLETGAPVPLDVLERITQLAPESTILASMSYARSGEVSLQGTVANEKECQDFLKKLTDLGRVDLRRARPDKNRFRFEVILTLKHAFKAAAKPASQPASQAASQPESKPAAKPTAASAPTGKGEPKLAPPAVQPAPPSASPAPAAARVKISETPTPRRSQRRKRETPQATSQPAGGAR